MDLFESYCNIDTQTESDIENADHSCKLRPFDDPAGNDKTLDRFVPGTTEGVIVLLILRMKAGQGSVLGQDLFSDQPGTSKPRTAASKPSNARFAVRERILSRSP